MAPKSSKTSSPASDHHTEIEAVISQATDLCVLEQIAALNTSHISDDSSLPTHLETRFRKLKSFPETRPQRINREHQEEEEGEENVPKSSPISSLGDPSPLREFPASVPAKKVKAIDSGNDSSRESPSPPRQTCCFGCSPRRSVAKKKAKGVRDWWESDEVLSVLRDQQSKMKKALKEQEKASREAEKMVRWVKQASARMDAAAIDELLSDDDEEFK